MNKFLERLKSGEVLVADGATGSNLQKMGLKPGQAPEDLVIDNPDIVLKLESMFVEAGSDIILTCTFGGTRMRMKDSKYQNRAPEVNIRAAELARKAASACLRSHSALSRLLLADLRIAHCFSNCSVRQATRSSRRRR